MSHLLWDKYLEFENSQSDISRVSQIITRILQLPIQQLDRYYSSFKSLITAHTLHELQSPEENAATAAVAAAAAAAATSAAVSLAESESMPAEGEGLEAAAGETAIALTAESDGVPKPEQLTEWSEEAEFAKFIAVRDAMYKAAKEQDAKIHDFESAIRRPYFHVKPLDDLQLANWHRYLDFIEKEGDFTKTVKLYERCLIACANYPEYWIRYVQRMDYEGSIEIASDALTRATQIFVKRRPEIHVFAARFKEQQGDIAGARFEYDVLNSDLAPGLLEGVVKSVNFEQRQGNTERALAIFESAIEYEKSKEESRSLPLLVIQYARFLDQVALKTERAREVYSEALAFLPLSKTLWEAVIHFESFRPGVKEVDYLDSLVEQATAPPRPDVAGLSAADREEISSIFLEFVDLFGDFQAVKKAEARHRQLFPFRKTSSESKKRPSPDGNVSDRAKVLKSYGSSTTTVSPAQAGPPAYANGQAQWGAGYGQQGYAQQPQTWQQPPSQQAPQMQPQQWNPGYNTQQAGYNAYGNYGAYGPPQQQVAPPQQQPAAYGAYAQNYAPQQQSYAQPAAAYAQQQQAPAQQGYYAGYY